MGTKPKVAFMQAEWKYQVCYSIYENISLFYLTIIFLGSTRATIQRNLPVSAQTSLASKNGELLNILTCNPDTDCPLALFQLSFFFINCQTCQI